MPTRSSRCTPPRSRPRTARTSGWSAAGTWSGQFHDAGLLDEVWIQYAPVTLGGGAPVLPRHVELRLEEVERNHDFACLRHSVVR